MNHYQDETKKKPLIQYQKMRYNQPTIAIKEKAKKDKSVEKQNIYEPQTKKFKDFNQSKYTAQYHQNQGETYKKSIPSNTALTPSQVTNNLTNIAGNISNMNKNLTFGLVKNNQNQKSYLTLNNNNDSDVNTNNHIISVNVNIQNMPNGMMDFKKTISNNIKYDIKPVNLKRNLQSQKNMTQNLSNLSNLSTIQNQRINSQQTIQDEEKYKNLQPDKNIKFQDDRRRVSNYSTITTAYTSSNATDRTQRQRYNERTSIVDRSNIDRNIQKNDRNDRKQKFKKQIQEKFIMTTSPVDKAFLCEEDLVELKTVQKIQKKQPIMLQKKLSQKKLSNPQIQNQSLNTQTQQRYTKKIDKKAIQMKELKQFEMKEEEINSIQTSESINVLFSQQDRYSVDPTYLEKNQASINWMIRAILIDWMRQLSFQYSLKRDTYHLSIVLLDNYLAKKPNIQKQVAQVVGATTMFIASKLEQLQCRPSESFAQSTQGICTAKDIQNWEIQICKTLQFNLNPPTICSLANRIMTQWDKYIDEVDYAMHHLCFEGKQKVYFKKLDEQCYKMFRQGMQFIDCVILDIQTSQYKPLLIVLSIMYLIIGAKVAGFEFEEIHKVFPRSSHYLLDRSNYFNDLFQNFVESTFGMTLLQILPSVQYTASYFNLNLTYQKPVLNQSQKQLEQMELQQYCSYQTYNRHMLKTVKSRFRGIMNAF